MTQHGSFIEVQGTAEGKPFSRADADSMLLLAEKGINDLVALQKQVLNW
jgi:ribonuclease PH